MLFLLVIIVLLMVASAPHHRYSRQWGYGPSGALGTVLLILLILYLLGHLRI